MHQYKLTKGSYQYKTVTTENYILDTNLKYPFKQEIDGKQGYFALCPDCENPIRLVNLFPSQADKSTRNITPHGRHSNKSIPGLASLNIEARNDCPRYHPKDEQPRPAKHTIMNAVSRQVLKLLMEQFHQVISLYRQFTGVNISKNKAQKILEQYLLNKGYLYMESSITNIPWIFAYRSEVTNLYMQYINDEAIRQSLQQHIPEVQFKNSNQLNIAHPDAKNQAYINIDLLFHNYVAKKASDGSEQESMSMRIVAQRNQTNIIIFEKDISFDYENFSKAIQQPLLDNPNHIELRKIAHQLIAPLINEPFSPQSSFDESA